MNLATKTALSFLAVTAVSGLALANAKPSKPIRYNQLPSPTGFKALSEEQYQKALKDAKATTRSIAEIDKVDDVTALSDDLKNIRSQIIGGPIYKNHQVTAEKSAGVKTPADIVALIKSLDSKYDSLETDAKFVAAQLIALKGMQSAVYRARHLIDTAELTKSAIITSLRLAASGQNVFFPTEQWKAGFDYLTTPTEGMGPDISTEEELHKAILSEVRPDVEKMYARINALNFSKPIYFDNKMAFSSANFVSDDDRYVVLGETERISTLSGMAFGISSMYVGLAYHWDRVFDTADSVARIYGFRATVSSLVPGLDFVDGATAEKRTSVIKKNGKLFTLREGGAQWTTAAYQWFVSGVQNAKIAWSMIKRDANSNSNINNVIDPRGFLPFVRQNDATLSTIESLVHGEGVSSAVVMGETVNVKFKELFENPPKDLKAFLPTEFDKGQAVIASPLARDTSGKLRGGYRNYMKGSPTAWDVKAYQAYFPDVKNNDDIKKAAKILSQTWGGALVGVSVGSMVF